MKNGVSVTSVADARKTTDVLLTKGVESALISLSEAGALLHSKSQSVLVPPFKARTVVETAERRMPSMAGLQLRWRAAPAWLRLRASATQIHESH